MIKCKCLVNIENNEYDIEYAYDLNDFPYESLIPSLYATFDIETSTIVNKQRTIEKGIKCYDGFMYHWQVCIQDIVCFGRTWEEYLNFMEKLKYHLNLSAVRKLIIYVHNLDFEFQFIKDFMDFEKIFATDKRKVLSASNEFFEFRCSYKLTNLSLKMFLKNTKGVKHFKGEGDLDYRKLRTPSTPLTEIEYGYCYNDVRGLYEGITSLLENDSLSEIPLTSTGYVRRECRIAMRKNKENRKIFQKLKISMDLYSLLKEGFRGGNTASNRYLCNMTLENLFSFDISSSYPYVMIAKKFPMDTFQKSTIEDIEELEVVYDKENYATIARYYFKRLKLKSGIPIPYLPIAKCTHISKNVCYNGRIIDCEWCETVLTEVDYYIIKSQYEYEEIYVSDFYFARKDYLPQELRNVIFEFFEMKSKLKEPSKSDEDAFYMYVKAKNKLNSIFGMCVTDILHDEYYIDSNGEWAYKDNHNQEHLDKFYQNRNNFLSYQWGVWVTAYARERLQEGIDICGLDCVYVDTDSVKFQGREHINEFEELNKKLIEENREKNILHTVNINGIMYMMGQWDREPDMVSFKTLGAKKYCYLDVKNKLHITVSGLDKKKGVKELVKSGGINAFKIGKVFTDSGRTVAYYNDSSPHTITINNDTFTTASNIAIVDTTYTLGITNTMLEYLESLVKGE